MWEGPIRLRDHYYYNEKDERAKSMSMVDRANIVTKYMDAHMHLPARNGLVNKS